MSQKQSKYKHPQGVIFLIVFNKWPRFFCEQCASLYKRQFIFNLEHNAISV